MTYPRLTAIDLFSGVGGASCGLRTAGFDVVAAVEVDERAATNYSLNHPATAVLRNDILDVEPADLLAETGLRVGELTLLKSCPPCQAFSSRGRRDPSDPRNDLVLDVFRFVSGLRPSIVMMENVRHLGNDPRLDKLVRQCRSIGYSVDVRILDAAEFGVPQRRQRLVLVGLHKSARTMPASQLFESLNLRDPAKYASAVDALGQVAHLDSDPASRWRTPSDVVARRIRAIPPSGSRDALPPELRLACHDRLDRSGRRQATEAYGRVPQVGPAPTMTTRCTTVACGRFIHPTEDRGLSLREAATLQSFPSSYRLEGYYDEIERQIGNALPPLMAASVASQALSAIGLHDGG